MIQPLNVSSATLSAMYTSQRALFNVTYGEFESVWPRFAMRVKSSTKTENYHFATFPNTVKEWVDERELGRLATEQFSITNKKWEVGFSVGRDEIDDDQLGLLNPQIVEMAIAMKQHPDERIGYFLNDAMDAGGVFGNGFDGDPLIDDDHTWNTGYTAAQDNKGTGKLDLTDGPTNIATVRNALKNFYRPNGQKFGLRMNAIMVASNLVDVAYQICRSPYYNLGAAGTTDAVVERGNLNPIYRYNFDIIENPWLDDNHWFGLVTNRALKPVILQWRRNVEFASQLNPDSDDVFNREEYKYGASYRGEVGPGFWFLIYGMNGTVGL